MKKKQEVADFHKRFVKTSNLFVHCIGLLVHQN